MSEHTVIVILLFVAYEAVCTAVGLALILGGAKIFSAVRKAAR